MPDLPPPFSLAVSPPIKYDDDDEGEGDFMMVMVMVMVMVMMEGKWDGC